jgi:hypothetical protein
MSDIHVSRMVELFDQYRRGLEQGVFLHNDVSDNDSMKVANAPIQ